MHVRSLTIFAMALACSMSGAALAHDTHSHEVTSGSYRLLVSDESRSLAKLSGQPIPAGSLTITEDHQFTFDTNIGRRITHREGRVHSDGDDLTLSFGDDLHMQGHLLDDGSLDISGLHFARKECGSVVGNWHVNKMDARIEFTPEGTFKFKCTGATSEGKYKADGGIIVLTWTAVDGEAVDPDTMHKKLIMDDEGTFWIDNYHYKKD